MIIKTNTRRVGGCRKLLSYVQSQGENESVEYIDGGPSGLEAAAEMAKMNGQKYGLLHIMISPETPLGPAGLQMAIDEIYDEYGIEDDAPFLLMKHSKIRNDGVNDAPHFHLVVPAATSSGRVINREYSKVRDEVIARSLELRLGHNVISGAHNDDVIKRLHRAGRLDLEYSFKAAMNGDREPGVADYNSTLQYHVIRKKKQDLNVLFQHLLKELKGRPLREIASALVGYEKQFPELKFDRGQRRGKGTINLYIDGDFVGGMRGKLGVSEKEITQILKIKGEYQDGRNGKSSRGDANEERSDRGENGRHFQSSLRRQSRSRSQSAGGPSGRDLDWSDASETRRSGDSRHAEIRNERTSGSASRGRRAEVITVTRRDRAAGRQAARSVRWRHPTRDLETTLRIPGVDRRRGNIAVGRPRITDRAAKLRAMSGPAALSKSEIIKGDRAAAAVIKKNPRLTARGELKITRADRIVGNRSAARLSELRRDHRDFMSTPVDYSPPSGGGEVFDLDDPNVMQKIAAHNARQNRM